MQYKNINVKNQIEGYNNRIAQLEAEHFSNTVYILEAELIGSEGEALKFKSNNESIELRVDALQKKVEELSELVADSEDTNGNDNTN